MHVSGKCRINKTEALLQLVLGGVGIVMFPTYILGRYLKSGRLTEILTYSVANPDTSLYVTYQPNRYMQPKVRAFTFIDHLMEHFGPQPRSRIGTGSEGSRGDANREEDSCQSSSTWWHSNTRRN